MEVERDGDHYKFKTQNGIVVFAHDDSPKRVVVCIPGVPRIMYLADGGIMIQKKESLPGRLPGYVLTAKWEFITNTKPEAI